MGVKEIICIGYVTYSRYFVVMQPNTKLSLITKLSCNRWSTDTAGVWSMELMLSTTANLLVVLPGDKMRSMMSGPTETHN